MPTTLSTTQPEIKFPRYPAAALLSAEDEESPAAQMDENSSAAQLIAEESGAGADAAAHLDALHAAISYSLLFPWK
jgi:hypothetical protein